MEHGLGSGALNVKHHNTAMSVSSFLSLDALIQPHDVVESGWLEHGPFAFYIVQALKPSTFVELGTHRGYSYFCVCQAVKKFDLGTACYAIDTWKGDEHAGFYSEEVYQETVQLNSKYSEFSTLVRSEFNNALSYFADGSIDLLHVDGRHFYEDVTEDFNNWLPKLSRNAIVLFHDTNVRTSNFGVWRLFEDLKEKYRTFDFKHGNGLGVLALGDVPLGLDPFFNAEPAQADQIRLAYSRLGANVTHHWLGVHFRSLYHETNHKLVEAQSSASRAEDVLRQNVEARRIAEDQLSVSNETLLAVRAELAAAKSELTKASEVRAELQQRQQEYAVNLEKSAREASEARAVLQEHLKAIADADAYRTRLSAIETSTIWRATKPLRTVANRVPARMRRRLRQMAKAGYWMMTPHKIPARIRFIRQRNQIQTQLPVVLIGHSLGATPAPPPAPTSAPPQVPTVRSMIRENHVQWAPLPVFSDRHAEPTLTIVTDSVDAFQLFGGVGTSLVVGAIAAREMKARLRIVTRDSAPDPGALGEVLHAHKVGFEGPVDFVHMPRSSDRPLPIGTKDTILTTSWWSTRAVLGSVDPRQVLYLLQEDERMFYPNGDTRLLCSETISCLDLRTIVNTRLLFDHLADGADPLPGLRERGFWFDPAFPAIPKSARPGAREGKKNFLFYARPNHARNLYWRGLEVIDTVVRAGVLSPSEWNIHFVGADLPDMQLPSGMRPKVWGKLPWAKYAELLSEMDLGLSLMDTPHPSYPPLDLAAAGAIVVTNTHGPKLSLEGWSRNIICAPPSVAGLSDALRRGAVLAHDTAHRAANVATDCIQRDWDVQLGPVIDWFLAGRKQ